MTRPRLRGAVALVTGAGRGIGRAHALLLAELGAAVVVNDVGAAVDGSGSDGGLAAAVVKEIVRMGGRAAADVTDVGDWDAAEALVSRTIERFGRLDVLVNNAGILRPRTIVGMTREDWDEVVRVNLVATSALTHFAAVHWRARAKAGETVAGRVVNTTSGSGLYGNGQANYATAKAGIAAFTVIAAHELGRYGVTANAIAPIAVTRMGISSIPQRFTPDHAAHLVAWLASPEAQGVTGRVFNVGGGHVSIAEGWHTGPAGDKEGLWTVDELDELVPRLVAAAAPEPDLLGYYPGQDRSPALPALSYDPPTTQGRT